MIRTSAIKALFLAAGVLGTGAAIVNCSRTTTSSKDDLGSVTVALTLSPGVIVNTVTYQVTGNGISPVNGSIDVTNTQHATALVPGLPQANNYLLTMDATSTDGLTMCHGTTNFNVLAGQTASATVVLQCRGPNGVNTGTVAINGRLDNCPFITGYSASALEAQVGSSINIGAAATDLDGNPDQAALAFSWAVLPTGIGTVGTPAAGSGATTFTCAAVGPASLSVSVSDGVCGETKSNVIPVNCIARVGGTGGATGTGGAGTGGAIVVGTGGATGTGGAIVVGTGGVTGTGGAIVVGTGGVTGTGGAIVGTGGAPMSCAEPVSGTADCGQCTSDNCSLAPAAGSTDGCCFFPFPSADYDLCKAVSACYAAATPACTNSGDPTKCFCGTNPITCFTVAGAANGPCAPQVIAAAKTTDPTMIRPQFVSATSPLGRATNLSTCRGTFCSAECAVQ